MSPQTLAYLSEALRKSSGLALAADKAYLLESRLMPLARKHGLESLDALADLLRRSPQKALLRDVTDAMTTNESFFFRDIRPFEQFRRSVLPGLLRAREARQRIRIWSAAASTGQEPYSLAICLEEESARLRGWKVDILATDINAAVLERARHGLYTQFEVQRGLPVRYLVEYFKQVGEMWQIDQRIRNRVTLRTCNLLDDLRGLGRFDVIFCRNVFIYFDVETRRRVLDMLADMLAEDGSLYLGGAETVLGVSDRLRPVPGQIGSYGLADACTAPALQPA